jgi:hypothetical protein
MKSVRAVIESALPATLSVHGQGTRPRILAIRTPDVMAWKLPLAYRRGLLEPERLVGRLVIRADGALLWF